MQDYEKLGVLIEKQMVENIENVTTPDLEEALSDAIEEDPWTVPKNNLESFKKKPPIPISQTTDPSPTASVNQCYVGSSFIPLHTRIKFYQIFYLRSKQIFHEMLLWTSTMAISGPTKILKLLEKVI